MRSCDPVSLVTGPGNIYVAATERLLKEIIGIDAEAGPPGRRARRRQRGCRPRRLDLISQAERPARAAVLVLAYKDLVDAARDGAAGASGRHDQAHRAGGHRAGRSAVGDRPRRRRGGLGLVNAYAAEHLEIQTRDATSTPPACAMPVRSSSAPGRRSASVTTPPTPTTCCPRVGAPAPTAGAVGAQSFLRGIHVVTYSSEALRGWAATSSRSPRAEDYACAW